MHPLGRAAVLLALALCTLGCQFAPKASSSPVSIGGFPIGDPADCSGGQCTRFIEFAIKSLDEKKPGHPAVVSAQLFIPDFRGPNGEHLLLARSGGHDLVVVLTLDGGGVVSVYVGCGVGIDSNRCFTMEPLGQFKTTN